MSYKKIIFFLALVLVTGWSACTREKDTPEPNPGPPVGTGEEAYLTFGMNLSQVYDDIITRADVDSTLLQRTWGLTEENFVSTVRLVLYGYEITGSYESGGQTIYEYDTEKGEIVRYAFDFNIESKLTDGKITSYRQYYYGPDNTTRIYVEEGAAGWPSSEGRPHLYKTTYSATGDVGEDTATGFITWARPVLSDEWGYKMLLIINPTSVSDANLDADVTKNHDLYHVTAIGQPLSLLEDALDVKQSNMRNQDKAGFAAPNYFLMTNHQGTNMYYNIPNGLITVEQSQLYSTEAMANENPVAVSVSRMVAKVTVAKDENMVVSPSGASVTDVRWDLSATNKKTYWMRKMTRMTNYNEETPGAGNTGNRLRLYAEDPNPAGLDDAEKADNFNYLTGKMPALNYYALDDAPIEVSDPEFFGYILENTMSDGPGTYLSQSDEWTTLWISCKYTPAGFSVGDSYYIWNGYIFTVDLMQKYATDPNEIPPIPALASLADAIDGCSKDLTQVQTESFIEGGFQYFYQGHCYYSFVIEHNTEEMVNAGSRKYGYGYYGVVRNIWYPYTISKVNGPGLPIINTEEEAYGYMTLLVGINEWEQREQQSSTGKPATELP